MIKRIFLFLIFGIAVSLMLVSCPYTVPEKGKMVVQNWSSGNATMITDVWTHVEGSTEWINFWHGECPPQEELSFFLEPGRYNVRVKTSTIFVPRFYETGYMQPILISYGDIKFIIFDGKGIYDMENQE
jgi:hypothetical protein